MAEENGVKINLSASTDALRSGLNSALEQVNSAFNQLNGSAESLMSTMGNLGKAFLGLTAAVAVGETFDKVIESTVRYGESLNRAQDVLGVSTGEAQVLDLALRRVGSSMEEFTFATLRMTMTMRTSPDAILNLGVALTDKLTGKMRNTSDVFLDVANKLASLDAGMRNQQGLAIFGRSWAGLQDMVVRVGGQMEKSKAIVQEFGASVNIEQVQEYEANIATLGYVFQQLSVSIGSKLIPSLINGIESFLQLAASVRDGLYPYLVRTGDAFSILSSSLSSNLGPAFRTVAEIIGGLVLTGLKELFQFFLETIGVVTMLSYAVKILGVTIGAVAAAIAHPTQAGNIFTQWKKDVEDLNQAANKAWYDIQKKFESPVAAPVTGNTASQGQREAIGGEQPDDRSRLERWKDELQEMRAKNGEYFRNSLADDIAYWQKKLAISKDGGQATITEQRSIHKILFDLHRQQAQQEMAVYSEEMSAAIEVNKGNAQKQIELAIEVAERKKQVYGEDSAEYARAQSEVLKLSQQAVADWRAQEDQKIDIARDHANSLLEIERGHLETLKNIGAISAAEAIQRERELNEQIYQNDLQALERKRSLYAEDLKERDKVNQEILKLQDKHNADIQKSNDSMLEAFKAKWSEILSPIAQAFETSIQGMIMGTESLRQATANIGKAILFEFINLGVKRLTNWIATELAMTQATAAGEAARGGIQQAGMAESIALSAAAALKKIATYAAEAFAGVTAFLAPMMGPYAPIGAAIVSGIVLAEGAKVVSAAGGYDIPAFTNPVVQAHAREMILPAELADKIRNMTDSGSMEIHIHAVDATSVRRLFMNHGNVLTDSLRAQIRNFRMPA